MYVAKHKILDIINVKWRVKSMLCQFTVKNFKSIRDEVTFDMQATAISEHEDRIIKDKDGELYLPVSAIYGPNGGGKSNVLAALHTLVAKILRPLYITEDNENKAFLQKRIVVEPFAFSECKNEPTELELFFRTSLAEYRYILHIKRDVIVYESLDRVKFETGRRSALFERDNDEIILKGAFSQLKVSDDLSNTLTLLSYLGITYKKNEVVKDVLGWFELGIDFLNYGNPIQELRMAVSSSKAIKKLMLQMIQEMDLDIVDFRVEEKEIYAEKDHWRIRLKKIFGVVTPILVLLNILVFIVYVYTRDAYGYSFLEEILTDNLRYVLVEKQYYRLLTSMFFHFSLTHLLSNMVVLIALGARVEYLLGKVKYICVYLFCGIVASVCSIVSCKKRNTFYSCRWRKSRL